MTTAITATSSRRLPILLCLGLIAAYPVISTGAEGFVSRLAPQLGEVPARLATEAAIWAYGALVLAIALVGEPRSLASIGLRRPTILTPLWGLVAAIGLLALGGLASFVTYKVLQAPNHTAAQIEALVRGSLIYGLSMAVRGGVIEEVLYRGLAIEQLTVLTGQRWLAALIATLVFVAVHMTHFDLVQLIPIAVAGTGLAAIYLWRRNLWINIIAHVLIDALAMSVVALKATSLY
jgi:membrane protease YdiL (CAAX protease family)